MDPLLLFHSSYIGLPILTFSSKSLNLRLASYSVRFSGLATIAVGICYNYYVGPMQTSPCRCTSLCISTSTLFSSHRPSAGVSTVRYSSGHRGGLCGNASEWRRASETSPAISTSHNLRIAFFRSPSAVASVLFCSRRIELTHRHADRTFALFISVFAVARTRFASTLATAACYDSAERVPSRWSVSSSGSTSVPSAYSACSGG